MAQIVAEEFGIHAADVYVVMGDTDLTPFNTGTHGSKLTTVLGNAVLFACQDAKRQIVELIKSMRKTGDLTIKNGNLIDGQDTPVMTLQEALFEGCKRRSGLPFIGMGIYEPDADMLDTTGYGNPAPTYPFGRADRGSDGRYKHG